MKSFASKISRGKPITTTEKTLPFACNTRILDTMHVSPNLRNHPLPSGSVCWQGGFWGDRFALCRDSALDAMEQILWETPNGASLFNFDKVAGKMLGSHEGTSWGDGDCYKWMEAITHVYCMTGNEAIRTKLDSLIGKIADAQEEDGYICTQIQLTDKQRWEDLRYHELYNMGHLITAAVTHHRITGSSTFLEVARKLGDYLHDVFAPRPPELAHFGFNPSQIMGLVDLYRDTGKTRYLDLAATFVDMRGSQVGGTDLNQSLLPLRHETSAVGHAVTSAYLYCGASDFLSERIDPELGNALEAIWDNVVKSKMYVTGGTSALHFGVSMRPELFNQAGGDGSQAVQPRAQRTQVHEAYGLEYQLPNATAYNETCANIAQAMWALRMLRLTGESQYADNMELILFNSVLSGMSLDGLRFCYTNPLRWYGDDHVLLSQDYFQRWADFHCYCCPPNVLRTLASLHEWAYGLGELELWVLLYGSSEAKCNVGGEREIHVQQETDYPWDGTVILNVLDAPSEFTSIYLRIPGWATDATAVVNDGVAESAEAGTFHRIQRHWLAGDYIRLNLPMKTRRLAAHPKVEEARNHVAFARGPIVYCAETADLDDIDKITEIYVSRIGELEPCREQGALGDVVTLKGQGLRLKDSPVALYEEAKYEEPQSIPITLIPYYTWNNRGIGQMSVWLPLLN